MKSETRTCSATLLAVLCLSLSAVGAKRQQVSDSARSPEARAALNAGVDSFKNAQYDDAIASFRKATQLEPGNTMAHLYLGTAYASGVVPYSQTPENLQTAVYALAEFDTVIELDPGNLTAIKQEAEIYSNIQRYDKAILWARRVTLANPKDAEAFYIIGISDWTLAYQNARRTFAEGGLSDDGEGNASMTRAACEKLRAENDSLVEDGVMSLTRAIELKPDYDDAMQYLQLTYRQHANFACGDAAARCADLKSADEWTIKAMATRKQTEARKEAAGREQ